MLHPLFGRYAGFTFAEVLFAVMILAIGFIMVAAMFPVAIQQTSDNSDETTAALVAKAAVEQMKQMATDEAMPVSGQDLISAIAADRREQPPVWEVGDSRYPLVGPPAAPSSSKYKNSSLAWQQLRGRMISQVDPRFATSIFYSRAYRGEGGVPYAQLFVYVSKSHTGAAFEDGDLPSLRPKWLEVRLRESGQPASVGGNNSAPDIVHIRRRTDTSVGASVSWHECVAEGTFLTISDDRQIADVRRNPNTTSTINVQWHGNGRVYRVGKRRADLDSADGIAFELVPGMDMPVGPAAGGPGPDLILTTADDNQNLPVRDGDPWPLALIIGKPWVNPVSLAGGFTGRAQEVSFYTTYIEVK